jgi:hypothetical protein
VKDKAVLGNFRYGGSDKRRSVVKANYTSSGKALRGSLRYYATRENSEELRQEREVFTSQGSLSRHEASEQLKQLEGVGYRIILSPDAPAETPSEELKEWTRSVMASLEHHHQMSWFAVTHAEESAHTTHAHVHVVAVIDSRLDKTELATLRQHGDAHWQDIQHRQHSLEHDHTQPQHSRDHQAGLEL